MNLPKSQTAIFCGAMSLMLSTACNSTPKENQPPERKFESKLVEGTPMYTVLGPDGIPSIDEPHFVSATDAAAFMQPDEMVMGVVGARGTAKAYSAWQLDGHEIVNDQLDGAAIAATW